MSNKRKATDKDLIASKDLTDLGFDNLQVLVNAGIIPENTPVSQIDVFARFCKEKGLSPFSGEVHLMAFTNKKTKQVTYSRVTGIDGARKIAARTQELCGCSDPQFDKRSDGSFKTMADCLLDGMSTPTTCSITVYRMKGGKAHAFEATVAFNAYAQRYADGNLKQKWATMPFHMISKCAEFLAIRKGFSDETSGLAIYENVGAIEGSNTGFADEISNQRMAEYEELLDRAKKRVADINSVDELLADFEGYPEMEADENWIEIYSDRRKTIEYEKRGK